MEKGNSRLHAMTAFALSEIYQKANNLELMEHYLLVAAISDVTSATKENVALQDIALFIYKHKTRSLKKPRNTSIYPWKMLMHTTTGCDALRFHPNYN